ncbi:MAG: methyltransferase domain-containing protein [Candidatus Moranbacteria bacterium]|nr:methyltransferase domain-containing protein [Candidatus Moranbacteria bacterium]
MAAGPFFQSDLLNFPYKNEFDLIGAFDVIEHIENDQLALENIYEGLKPGGGVIISVPQHKFLWSFKDAYSGHKRRYGRAELKGKVEEAGFKGLKIFSFTSFLLPLMYIASLKYKKCSDTQIEETIYNEFNISSYLNKIFKLTASMELFFIKCGINFPFGGSLFIVAHK